MPFFLQNLPALKDYTASKEFMTRLFNGADALWCGDSWAIGPVEVLLLSFFAMVFF